MGESAVLTVWATHVTAWTNLFGTQRFASEVVTAGGETPLDESRVQSHEVLHLCRKATLKMLHSRIVLHGTHLLSFNDLGHMSLVNVGISRDLYQVD